MPELDPLPRVYSFADLTDEGLDDATRRHDAHLAGRPLGPVLPGFPELEKALGGYLERGLHILTGAPGSSKTALANAIAADAGCPAMIATFEMSPLTLQWRAAARITKTFYGKFRRGDVSPGEWLSIMRRTAAAQPMVRIFDGTKTLKRSDGTPVPYTIRAIAEAARVVKGEHEHVLIVIDSLHSFVRKSGMLEGRSQYHEVLEVGLSALNELAHELNAAILVLAEQNRATMGSELQQSSAGSRAFEYVGELVLTLQSKGKSDEKTGEKRIVARLAKNRWGTEGHAVMLGFTGKFMSFRELDEEPTEAEVVAIQTKRRPAKRRIA